MTLLDGQYLYGGLLMGQDTPYGIRRIEGLEDLTVRSSDRLLPRGHGAVPGAHFAAPKDILFEFVVKSGGSPALLADRITALRDAFQVERAPLPLSWKRIGQPERLINVAPLHVQHTEEVQTVDRVAFPRLALTAADPRIYSVQQYQALTSTFSASGLAIDYPFDYALDFPAGAGDGVVSNRGNENAYPVIQCFGPTDGGTITGVTIRNLTTGQEQSIQTPIAAGQVLIIDNLAFVTGTGEQVVHISGSSRYGSWVQPRVPFAIPPGSSSIRYETTGSSASSVCVLTWRDTWL